MPTMASRVVVIGAGPGGLAAAISLARAGLEVTLLERADVVGGKIHAREVGGVFIDAGPTVLTMPWVFEELFATTGARFEDYVTLAPLEVLARHAFADGTTLDLFADHRRSVEAIAELAGRAEARRFEEFSADARRIYQTVKTPFIESERPSLGSLVRNAGTLGLGALMRIDAHRTLHKALSKSLRDPRLVQLFARYATYVGASPFEAPATLNLISHVEALGVFRVKGGMRALAAGLERRAIELGVEVRTGAHVREVVVRNGRAVGALLDGGELVHARAVVSNTDVSAIADGSLGRQARPAVSETARPDRSLSAFTMALVGKPQGFALDHHNVFFSSDYEREFRELLVDRRVPNEPTVYLCASERAESNAERSQEKDDEPMFLVVNAPASGDEPARWTEAEKDRCTRATLTLLKKRGLELTISASVTETPLEWARRFPSTGGALYGARPRGLLSPFTRAGARSKIAGLYLAGGSVHPGPGVPMATLSGVLAADAILRDLHSTVPSPTAATNGITWMG